MITATDRELTNREPNVQHFVRLHQVKVKWLSTALLCLMTATLVALFWFPVKRTFTDVEVNYNEGWNAYKAAMVASGIPLYRSPPETLTGGVYSPLSFHLIAALGTPNTYAATGRWVSL